MILPRVQRWRLGDTGCEWYRHRVRLRCLAAPRPIKIEDTAGKMHPKLMIVDAEGSDPTVVTDSLNWTAAVRSIVGALCKRTTRTE